MPSIMRFPWDPDDSFFHAVVLKAFEGFSRLHRPLVTESEALFGLYGFNSFLFLFGFFLLFCHSCHPLFIFFCLLLYFSKVCLCKLPRVIGSQAACTFITSIIPLICITVWCSEFMVSLLSKQGQLLSFFIPPSSS